jgi:sulfoxide reductase catalytic subunit YedY
MFVHVKQGWELPERLATDEAVFNDRRRLLKSMGFGAAALGAAAATASSPAMAAKPAEDPSASLYPVKRNETYKLDRPLTEEKWAVTYNNYYEFGSHKRIAKAAQALKLRPWQVRIDGEVEKEITVDIDDLLKKMPLEERVYRFRCVEAWSMAVPWSGFPLRALVEFAKPTSNAKYVRMETLVDKETMPGVRQAWYPWPYVEGLTIAEATNDLAFIATGLYGKPIPRQNGAPLRLAVPWKYGFKSIKSLVKFTFTKEQPKTFWEVVQGAEYGFWANVNPKVSHPRWSQAEEEPLGQSGKVPTLPFNGYGEFVAALYKDLEPTLGEKLYR